MARPQQSPRSARGRAVCAHLETLGLSMSAAAQRAGINYRTLHDVVHKDSLGSLTLSSVEALVTRLDIPLSLLSPGLARHVA